MPFFRVPHGCGGGVHHHGRHHHRPGHPFPTHHGPPGQPPRYGRRGHRFILKKNLQRPVTAIPVHVPTGDADPNPAAQLNKPLRRPHCRRGGPRGKCSDLPRESPLEVSRNEDANNNTDETTRPAKTVSFRHYPPRSPHFHHRRRHQRQKMMWLSSLLEEQKHAMEELEEQNKDKKTSQEDEAPAKENSATSNPSAIQVSQQWHVKETDQSLILSIDVSGFKLENLQLKVEGGLLSLQGQRTNSLGDVFELSRTKMIDPNIYHEAGIEARCDNEDEACSIVRITIPKKEYTPVGTIPIQYVECSNELSEELSATNTTSSVLQDNEKEQDSGGLEDDVFIPEAEIVFERHEEEESALGQVETVEDSSITGNVEAPQELYQSGASENTPNEEEEEVRTNDSDSTQSWEDVLVDGRQGQE